jgi:hypothetical protein
VLDGVSVLFIFDFLQPNGMETIKLIHFLLYKKEIFNFLTTYIVSQVIF